MKTRHLQTASGRHAASFWGEDRGQDSGSLNILALHGFTGSGLDFAPLAQRLPHPLLAPDLIGHGRSPAPTSVSAYRIEAAAEHCLAWCDSAPEWVVMGYSMGGRVALRLARLLGERLKGLVLIGASPGIEQAEDRRARAVQDDALAARIETEGMAWFCDHWARHPVIQSQQSIPPELRVPMQERRSRNRAAGLAGSLRGMGQGQVAPVWQELHTIGCPTLLLTGERDRKYAAIAARMAGLIPRSQHMEIPEAGHCAHLEAVDAATTVIDAWLGDLRATHPPPSR